MLSDEQTVFLFILSLLGIRHLYSIFTDKPKVNQLVSRGTKFNPCFFYCKAVLYILLQCYAIYYIWYIIYKPYTTVYYILYYNYYSNLTLPLFNVLSSLLDFKLLNDHGSIFSFCFIAWLSLNRELNAMGPKSMMWTMAGHQYLEAWTWSTSAVMGTSGCISKV